MPTGRLGVRLTPFEKRVQKYTLEGWSPKDIALFTGQNQNTINATLARIRNRLPFKKSIVTSVVSDLIEAIEEMGFKFE